VSLSAVEESSIFVSAAFTDEDDVAVTPNVVTWTLSDVSGNVINSRSDVSVTPDTTVTVLLEGDDLPWSGSNTSDAYNIYILFEAEYDSGSETDIPLKEQETISVRNLQAVS